jgi:hypothetical protein
MSESLTERYDDRIAGVLSCYDRVVITGTLPGICYAKGMTRYLHANGIRIFDYRNSRWNSETGYETALRCWRSRAG